MTTVTVATVVAAPVERVFDVFTDVEHGAERVSNIQKVEMLTFGGVKLGSRWLETREVLGHQDSAEMEVTAFERNRTYTITHQKAGVRIDAVFTFEPVEDRWEPATVPLGGHDRRPPIVFRIHIDSFTGRRTIHEARTPERQEPRPESERPGWLTRMRRRLRPNR